MRALVRPVSQLSLLEGRDPEWTPASYLALLCSAWRRHRAARPRRWCPTVVSTFAGGGGSSLGYSVAGYRELLATDHDEACCRSFRRNFPGVEVVRAPIGELSAGEVLDRTGLSRGELDVLDGSPPCQGFSRAGNRQVDDERNRLWEEYARLLEGLRPKAMVVENVAGLVRGDMKRLFAEMLRGLRDRGYRVRAWVLDAKYFHVPQQRRRTIFVGLREDLGVDPTPPDPESRPITVREAIGLGGTVRDEYSDSWQDEHGGVKPERRLEDAPMYTISASGPSELGLDATEVRGSLRQLPSARGGLPVRAVHNTGGDREDREVSDSPLPTLTVGVDSLNSRHYLVEEVRASVEELEASRGPGRILGFHHPSGFNADGRRPAARPDAPAPSVQARGIAGSGRGQTLVEWLRLPPSRERGYDGAEAFHFRVADADEPAPTFTTVNDDVGHPVERRKLTIPELKVLSSFPLQFELPGEYATKWTLVGNAVPPLMMEAIARHLRGLLREAGAHP